jgi:chitodextrinase
LESSQYSIESEPLVPLAPIPFPVFPALLSRLRSIASCTALAVSLLCGCSGDELVLPGGVAPRATNIEVVNGNGQTGQVGEMLELPLEVEVTDAAGDPVRGATVVFELTSAGEGAEVTPSPATTDAGGHAEAHVLLGDKVGLQTGAAHVVVGSGTGPSATFSAIANPGTNSDNRAPDADYNWHCQGLSCQFTNASNDPDGTVIRWDWDFGDGGTSDLAEPLHLYPAPGTYEVTLIVTDNNGATDESTAHVDVESD